MQVNAVAERTGKLCKMIFKFKNEAGRANISVSKENVKIWHQKLVHQNIKQVKTILNNFNVPYIDEICSEDKSVPNEEVIKLIENQQVDICLKFMAVVCHGFRENKLQWPYPQQKPNMWH